MVFSSLPAGFDWILGVFFYLRCQGSGEGASSHDPFPRLAADPRKAGRMGVGQRFGGGLPVDFG